VKVLHPAFADHAQFRERFERESDVLCRLEHPNVVDVVDRGQDGDLLWMSMRYIPGPDLDTALRERGPFSPEQAVAVVAGVGRALDAAHAAGLLHRDVKPANILLRRAADGSEEAMLTDFGIAKDLAAAVTLTRAGEAPATIAYASPEQLEGLPIGRRADVYSLGAVLFELLTGRRAFPADDIGPLLASVIAGPVPDVRSVRQDLPVALAEVVRTALQKDPADRFASCGQMVAAAEAALVSAPRAAPRTTIGRAEAPPPPPPPPAAPRARPAED
jgi:serine/threonine protein kinase